MLPSWRLALNNLAGRRGRTALMTGAVALAAALIVAVSCGISTVQFNLEHRITRFLGNADARLIHPAGSRFDEELLQTVRGWPEVRAATGRLSGALTLIHADRRRDEETGRLLRATPDVAGADFEAEREFRRFDLLAGSMPRAANEIVLDPHTADALDAEVGDVLEVQRFGDPITLTVAGIENRPRLGAIQRPRIRADRKMLGEATGRDDFLSSVYIILHDDEDVEAFCERHVDDVPEALSLEPAEMVRSGFDKRVEAGELGLVLASVLTFLCASFIIVTGLTTGITERQREMALLRCVGAKRSHLFFSQLLVGAAFGAVGAAVGIPLGVGLAKLLELRYHDMLPAGLHVSSLGVSLGAIGSLAAGLAGALYPAIYATRVTPLQAMSHQAAPVRARSIVACTAAVLALVALQLLLMLRDDPEAVFWSYVTVGLPGVFIASFLAAVPVLLIVTALLARPLAMLLRLPADLLRGSVLATPFRHGFTAGAMMVGMAILVDGWAAGASLLEDWVEEIRFSDGFAFRTTGIPVHQQEAITALPFVAESCAVSYTPVRIIGRQVFGLTGLSPQDVVCIGFESEDFFRINRVDWTAGDPETAAARLRAGEGVIVADRFLIAKNLGVGDTLTLGLGRVEKEFEIVGVVSAAGLDIAMQILGMRSNYTDFAISCVFLDFQTVAELFDNRDAFVLQINLTDEVSDEEAISAIRQAAPGVDFFSGRFIKRTVTEITVAMLGVQSTIAFAALVLAALAVGNVIAANIQGRRFEYGVMRAVGTHRGMLLRLVLAEALLLAITGAAVGTGFGFHLAWMDIGFMRDLAGLPVRVALPLKPIAVGWAVLIGVTLLAALPAAFGLVRSHPSAMLSAGRNA